VVFAHDTEMSLQAAVELTNTASPPDTLDSVAALDSFYADFEYTGRHERTREELEQVRALRPRFRALFTSSREEAVAIVNLMLSEAGAVPQLVRHDPYDWHVHACPPDAPLATRMTVETAMAMVDVIRTDEMSRLGVCEDEDCEGIVLDLSRNRSKRFCSTTCGNRNAVAAYRARQAGEA
jgi:predicted RNA-binding Zn ribbon-like protein